MSLALKPNHAAVKAYYDTLHQFGQLHIDHEGAVRSAFQTLLAKCGQKASPKLTLVPEYRIERVRSSVVVDGALIDLYHLPHGYWEAKDQQDDLAREVSSKLEKGYPRDNIIFQAPERVILYQGGTRVCDQDISRPEPLVEVVNTFFDYKAPHILEWEEAVREFSDRIPQLAAALTKNIDEERKQNSSFVRSFDDFYALCRQAINPNLSKEAVERMLVQHLLTERIFRKIFNNPDFTRRNVVAAEIEKVISELTRRAFNRDEFLSGLDRFYRAIEQSAENTSGFSAKQAFLNTVYERFFQGYSPKEADTHGIVYTPQSIVNFMVRSVEEILQKEFGRSLGDRGVHILDPFVGTGNFIVRIMQEIKTTDLPYKYENELHCNEIMLLPYYIASMNIEHAYFDRTGEYKPFPGICLVDTFELTESEQGGFTFMNAENTDRVRRQRQSPIFVIIGNPPYNSAQVNENDANKNRKYPTLEARISSTYAADSEATLKSKLSDVYVKAYRWASDRIGKSGMVAFVSNNSFITGKAFDGMRHNLLADFDSVYHLNFKGNARTSGERRKKEAGNLFLDQIRVGVGVTLLVRNPKMPEGRRGTVDIWNVADCLDAGSKTQQLEAFADIRGVPLERLQPQSGESWFAEVPEADTSGQVPLGIKSQKKTPNPPSIFGLFSLGVATNRDQWAYNSRRADLEAALAKTAEHYGLERSRWERCADKEAFEFNSDDEFIKWTDRLKIALTRSPELRIDTEQIRTAMYRPFEKRHLYFDALLNQRRYQQHRFWPPNKANTLISLNSTPASSGFYCLAIDVVPDLHLTGDSQCFPFYVYAKDGSRTRENITGWSLDQFRTHYADKAITKWDIFHYVYAVLHHPEYREHYAANLRRELPRIPFVPVSQDAPTDANTALFRSFAKAGKSLVEIHVNYEKQPEYKLKKIEKKGEKLDYCVTKMLLSKDKTQLVYNQFLTLSGIPPETFEYRLGNRSALEWIVDQYQVSTDKRSGITNDPNRADDPTYILRLIGQVITVSLETVKLVNSLPPLGLPNATK